MKNTVSLFLYIPARQEIILSQRAAEESKPRMLQATVHGAMEAEEEPGKAVVRELYEETGLEKGQISDLEFLETRITSGKKPEKVNYFKGVVEEKVFDKLQPGTEVEGFIKVKWSDINNILSLEDAELKGISTEDAWIMFQDERQALEDIFTQI